METISQPVARKMMRLAVDIRRRAFGGDAGDSFSPGKASGNADMAARLLTISEAGPAFPPYRTGVSSSPNDFESM
jgi:hypothetical protein